MSLGKLEDLHGRVVLVDEDAFRVPQEARRFLALWGFGCAPHAVGRAVFGVWLHDGARDRINREEIERLDDDQVIPAALESARTEALAKRRAPRGVSERSAT